MLAANQDNAAAQHNLALMYHFGQGVLQDYCAAVEWYLQSAQQGNTNAQINLGQMYFNGYGVLQNYVTAYMWWKIAASNGDKTARRNLGQIIQYMLPKQIKDAEKLADVYWINK